MKRLTIARWTVACDPDATRALYERLPAAAGGCGCSQCRNYTAAVGTLFPPAIMALADALGVDLAKPAELAHWYREPTGGYLTDGWFHFVGRIVDGADTHPNEDGTGVLAYQPLAPGVDGGFTRHPALVAEAFAGQEVVQWKVQTSVPWVLEGVPEPP